MAPHAEEPPPSVEAVTDTQSTIIPDPVMHKNPTKLSHSRPSVTRFSIDDILPHREASAPMSKGVAAFSSADMFKSTTSRNRSVKAKDFAHRLSEESKARKASSLKGAMKYFREGMVSLCGGLPSSDYFPFENLSVTVPQAPAFDSSSEYGTVQIGSGKHDAASGDSAFDLSIALNYGQSMGPPQLMRFVTEHTEIVHDPPYADWEICLTQGSTSALEIALRMFGGPGTGLLTEEFSFSSAIETALPLGIKPIGIKMDERGMLAEDLDERLSNWNEEVEGIPKPFLLYTVPTGQNPTSSTQPLERRKAIYAVAEKHDLYILEDEPYYFLQMEPYRAGVTYEVPVPFQPPMSVRPFLDSLVPSYLSLDISGRVLRMDSFSKIIAPGSRTGWVTGSAQIIERFIRHSEVSAQNPSGFAMMSLYKLLEETWGHRGFLEWLMFIRAEYTRRRDVIVNACETYVPQSVARFSAPMAGMFHWIRVDPEAHPLWKQKAHTTTERADLLAEIEDRIFLAAVKHNVLVARGSWFRAEKDNNKKSPVQAKVNGHTGATVNGHAAPGAVNGAVVEEDDGDSRAPDLFFRMTFAAAAEDKMIEAVKRFGDALKEEFEL